MNDKKAILKQLTDHGILTVVIGGMALRMYNSPRLTHDIDFAIRTLDVDDVVCLMYAAGYALIKEIRAETALLATTADAGLAWVEATKSGSLSFVAVEKIPVSESFPLNKIDINTQIDFLFELSIPIINLDKRARKITLDNFTIKVACPEDLLVLKENRKDKSAADYADIDFLKKIIKQK